MLSNYIILVFNSKVHTGQAGPIPDGPIAEILVHLMTVYVSRNDLTLSL